MDGGYLGLIRRLATLQPPMYLFGGVAEDAVLDGVLDRPHGDLDVLVRRSELPERLRQAEGLGFPALDIHYEPLPGRPLVLGGSSGDLNLELGVVDEDPAGFSFVAGGDDGRLHRVEITGDLFSHPPVVIGDIACHVVSPLALFQMRNAFTRLGTFGAPREKDVTVQARLREFLEQRDLAADAPSMSLYGDLDR